jgi:DNA-binding transcriptional MerR regulator
MSEKPDFIRSKKFTAKVLNTSERTIHRLDQRGLLPRTQVSARCHGYRDSVIAAYVDRQTRAGNSNQGAA